MAEQFDRKVDSERKVRLPCGCLITEFLNAAHERITTLTEEQCRDCEYQEYIDGVAEARAEARYERTGRRW